MIPVSSNSMAEKTVPTSSNAFTAKDIPTSSNAFTSKTIPNRGGAWEGANLTDAGIDDSLENPGLFGVHEAGGFRHFVNVIQPEISHS